MGDEFNEGFDDFDSNMTDPGEVFDDFPDEIADDLPAEIPDDYPDEIPDDFPDEIPDNFADEIPAEIPDEVPAEIPDEIPAEIPNEIPTEIPDEIPDEIPAEIPDEIPAEIPDDTLHQGYIDSPVTGDGNADPIAISGYEQAEEVSEEIDSAGQELNDIPFEVSEPEDRPALDAMSQYMADHNYSPEDAAEYQKDPEWQALNRDLQEEDGIERDPHQDMQEYMINHNYGLGDTPEFHADPEWQEINNRVLESEGAQPVNYEEMIPPEEDMAVSDEIPDDYETPEDVTEMDAGGDGIPEYVEDTEIPEETEVIPEDTEVVPEVTEEVPQVTEANPEDPEVVPEVTEEVPEEPETAPEVQEEIPEETASIPEVTEEVPQVTEAIPEDPEVVPEAIEEVSQVTEANPEDPEAVPEVTEEVPQVTEANPEDPEAVPETPEEMPETPEVVPEVTEDMPEAPEVVPETPEEMPEDTEMVPETPEDMPEDVEVVPEAAEEILEDPEVVPEDTEPVTAEVAEETESESSVENMEATSDHPALDAMAQYMSDHNYEKEDAEEYRKDPEWQRLNRDLLIESGLDPADFGGEPAQEIPGSVERVDGVAQELEMGEFEKKVTLENPDFYKNGEFLKQGLNEYGFNGTCGETTQANTINRLFETNRFTENNVLDVAVNNGLCTISPDSNICGATRTDEFLQLYEKMDEQLGGNKLDVQCFDYENALSPEEVAAQLESGKLVNVSVDADCLWDKPQNYVDNYGNPIDALYSDHWITVTGVNRDAAGNVESFDILDSGGGRTNVSLKKYVEMCFGNEYHDVIDPTTIVVSRKDTQNA